MDRHDSRRAKKFFRACLCCRSEFEVKRLASAVDIFQGCFTFCSEHCVKQYEYALPSTPAFKQVVGKNVYRRVQNQSKAYSAEGRFSCIVARTPANGANYIATAAPAADQNLAQLGRFLLQCGSSSATLMDDNSSKLRFSQVLRTVADATKGVESTSVTERPVDKQYQPVRRSSEKPIAREAAHGPAVVKTVLPSGLENVGQMCYANALLQCVIYLPYFSPFLQSHYDECRTEEWCLACEIAKVSQSLRAGGGVVVPQSFMGSLYKINSEFVIGVQQDAESLLGALLDVLAEQNAAKSELCKFQGFLGILRESLECSKCKNTSESRHPIDAASLSLLIGGCATIDDALNILFAPEVLDSSNEFLCHESDCRKMSQATKQVAVEIAPGLLCLHLKRYLTEQVIVQVGDKRKRQWVSRKLDHHVSFPEVEGAARVYDLMSIVVHLGDNTSSGHYISYVKTSRIEDPCWVKFNDSQVSYVSAAHVHGLNAYLVFYAQRTDSSPVLSQLVVVPQVFSPSALSIHSATPPTAATHVGSGSDAWRCSDGSDSAAFVPPSSYDDDHPSELWPGYRQLLRLRHDSPGTDQRVLCTRISVIRQRLSERDSAAVEVAWRRPADGKAVLSPGLLRSDAMRLRSGKWLNDVVINLYMQMLAVRHNSMLEKHDGTNIVRIKMAHGVSAAHLVRPIFIFGTYFFATLTKHKRTGLYDYKRAKNHTRRRPTFVDIFKCGIVLVPINIHRLHWLLAVIFPQHHAIAIIDSLNGDGSFEYAMLLRYLADEHKARHGVALPGTWQRIYIKSSRQTNGDDCGVFVLMEADFLLAGEPLTDFTASDAPLARRYILSRILDGSIKTL